MTLSESTLSTVLNFDLMETLLAELDAIVEPAEFHGVLCGHLCGGARYDRAGWLKQSLQILDIENIQDEQGTPIYQFYQAGLEMLGDTEYGFQLVLPSDDSSLLIRLEHLAHWCEGFLSGFGLINNNVQLSEELEQILQDLTAIAQVEVEVDDNEENETRYMELVEFVRMAVLNIFFDSNHVDGNADELVH